VGDTETLKICLGPVRKLTKETREGKHDHLTEKRKDPGHSTPPGKMSVVRKRRSRGSGGLGREKRGHARTGDLVTRENLGLKKKKNENNRNQEKVRATTSEGDQAKRTAVRAGQKK